MKNRPGLDRFIPALTGFVLSAIVATSCVRDDCRQAIIENSDLFQCQQGNLYSCMLSRDSASNIWENRISFNQLPPNLQKAIFDLDLQIRNAKCQAIGYTRPDSALSTR